MNLENTVAVITGATSGIGLKTAQVLHQHGVRLVLHGRNRKKLIQIASETNATYVLGDIIHPELPNELLQTALTNFDRCDILINNAAVIEAGIIEEIDIEKICQMVRINVEASFRVVYTFLKYFKQKDAGYVVNLSSILGTKVRETAGAYAATKFAIEALSEALRMELARTNVKITCIEPGLVKTGLHRNWEVHPVELFDIPEPLTAEDIANTILYVLEKDEHIRIPKLLILPRDHVI